MTRCLTSASLHATILRDEDADSRRQLYCVTYLPVYAAVSRIVPSLYAAAARYRTLLPALSLAAALGR